MVIHDLQCSTCNTVYENIPVDPDHLPVCPCGGNRDITYAHWRKDLEPNTHPSERVVLYQSAKEGGAIQYPGRSDVPVPERLRARGYEKVELNVRDLASFEKKHHVMNERRHFDRNGKGL